MEFGIFLKNNLWILPVLALWIYPWKAVALWKAAKNNQYVWFGILLVLNTLGILEIVYIVFFSKTNVKKNIRTVKRISSRKKTSL